MQEIRTEDLPVASRVDEDSKSLNDVAAYRKPNLRGFGVIALDLDGTLLDDTHSISDATKDYLRELHSRNLTIVIATGRAAPSVYDTVRRLDLPTIPVVCSNGARGLLCEPPRGESTLFGEAVRVQELFSTPVPQDITERVLRLATKLGHVVQFYHANDIYANPSQHLQYRLTRRYSELTGAQTVFVSTEELLSLSGSKEEKLPSKLLVLCEESQLDETWQAFQQEFSSGEVTLVYGSMGWFLEILHKDVCKGHGLRRMCEHHLNCRLEDVVAFGDGDNDLEFIQWAGRGVVMKNGRDVVKKVADEMTLFTNNEDGVIRTLQRMEKEGLLQPKGT